MKVGRTKSVAGIVLGLLVVGLVTWIFLTRDIPPIDDSDLSLEPRQADPTQNPFPEIRRLKLSWEDRDRIQAASAKWLLDREWDEESIAQLLDDFSDELDLLGRYAAMSDWLSGGSDSFQRQSYLNSWHSLCSLKNWRS